MGCFPSKNSQKLKTAISLHLIESTFLDTFISRLSQNTFTGLKTCTRFAIPIESEKILRTNLLLLMLDSSKSGFVDYTLNLNYLFKDYQKLKEIRGYFELCVHKICICDYRLLSGFIIFGIFLQAEGICPLLTANEPYLIPKNTENMSQSFLSSWSDYSSLCEELYKKYITNNHYESLISRIDNRIAKTKKSKDRFEKKRNKNLNRARGICISLIEELYQYKQTVEIITDNSQKIQSIFQKYGDLGKKQNLKACDKIVHSFLVEIES